MNDCPRGDIRDLLPDLLHGRLDADSRAGVEQHVALCAECAAELELLRTMRDALRTSPAIDATRMAAAVREGAARRSAVARPRTRRLDWRVAAAAAVLVTGGLTVAVVRRAPGPVGTVGTISSSSGTSANSSGLMFGGGVADLSNSDLERLLQDVDSLSALPDIEPAPVLRGVGTDGL